MRTVCSLVEAVDSGEYDVFENDREGSLRIELEALHGLRGHHGAQQRRGACRAGAEHHVAATTSAGRRRRGRDAATGVVDQSANAIEHVREQSVTRLWTGGRGGAAEQALLVRVVGHGDELANGDPLP